MAMFSIFHPPIRPLIRYLEWDHRLSHADIFRASYYQLTRPSLDDHITTTLTGTSRFAFSSVIFCDVTAHRVARSETLG